MGVPTKGEKRMELLDKIFLTSFVFLWMCIGIINTLPKYDNSLLHKFTILMFIVSAPTMVISIFMIIWK